MIGPASDSGKLGAPWQGMGMHVWRGCDEVPAEGLTTCAAIGAFDGVHRGHRLLLDQVVVAAREDHVMPVVVTFDPHPRAVIRPEAAPLLLTTLRHRLELLEQAGIGGVLVLPFSTQAAMESPAGFAERVLARTLHAVRVVVGRNFRFGHRAAGDVVQLTDLGRRLGFEVTALELAELDHHRPGDPKAVSSTAIRTLVAAGKVKEAADALGRPHRVSGEVTTGDRRGRELGYPTANLDVAPGLAVPGDGVYAARLRSSCEPGTWRDAAVSVGSNPTFQAAHRRVEAFVLDAPSDYDIYGTWTDVEFLSWIRPMTRFATVPALIAQMDADVARVRDVVGRRARAGISDGGSSHSSQAEAH